MIKFYVVCQPKAILLFFLTLGGIVMIFSIHVKRVAKVQLYLKKNSQPTAIIPTIKLIIWALNLGNKSIKQNFQMGKNKIFREWSILIIGPIYEKGWIICVNNMRQEMTCISINVLKPIF